MMYHLKNILVGLAGIVIAIVAFLVATTLVMSALEYPWVVGSLVILALAWALGALLREQT